MGNWNFGAFWQENHAVAWRCARRLKRDDATVEDIVSKTFLYLFERQARFAEPPSKGVVWKTAYDFGRNHLRGIRARPADPLLEDPQGALPQQAVLGQSALTERLEHCLGALPDPQRWCLMLSACWGLDHDEAAELLGLTRNAYNIHRSKGMANVRECMGEEARQDSGDVQ